MTDNIVMETFSDRLFFLLEQRGLSQTQLSERTGLTQNAISLWKSRGTIPRADDALRIADVLGVPVEYLILGQKEQSDCLMDRVYKLNKDQISVVDAVVNEFEKQNKRD